MSSCYLSSLYLVGYRVTEENIHHNIGHYPPWEKFYKSYRLENLTCQPGPEKQEGNIKIKMRSI